MPRRRPAELTVAGCGSAFMRRTAQSEPPRAAVPAMPPSWGTLPLVTNRTPPPAPSRSGSDSSGLFSCSGHDARPGPLPELVMQARFDLREQPAGGCSVSDRADPPPGAERRIRIHAVHHAGGLVDPRRRPGRPIERDAVAPAGGVRTAVDVRESGRQQLDAAGVDGDQPSTLAGAAERTGRSGPRPRA